MKYKKYINSLFFSLIIFIISSALLFKYVRILFPNSSHFILLEVLNFFSLFLFVPSFLSGILLTLYLKEKKLLLIEFLSNYIIFLIFIYVIITQLSKENGFSLSKLFDISTVLGFVIIFFMMLIPILSTLVGYKISWWFIMNKLRR